MIAVPASHPTKRGGGSQKTPTHTTQKNKPFAIPKPTSRTERNQNMEVKIFAVYDSKAEAYLTPFFSPTTATAIRAFEAAAQSEDHDFSSFAADYTLMEIGEFEHNTAAIRLLDAPFNLGTALTYKKALQDVVR